MMRCRVAVLAGLLVLPTWAAAQGPRLSVQGRVLYADTQKAAGSIPVDLLRLSMPYDRAYSDSSGEFSFYNLGATRYELRIQVEGYRPLRVEFDLALTGMPYFPVLYLELPLARPSGEAPAGTVTNVREAQIPEEARQAFEKGHQELNKRKHAAESVPHFQEAIRLYPDYDEAYVQLGLAFFLQKKRSDSLRTLARAVDVYPQNARAWALLGKVLLDTGQREPALQALEEALLLDDTMWNAHVDRGVGLWEAKRLEEALVHAERAHQLAPQEPSPHVLLCTLLSDLGRDEAAMAEMDEFLRLFPKSQFAPQIRKQRDETHKRLRSQKP